MDLKKRGAGAVALSIAAHGSLVALLLVSARWMTRARGPDGA